MERSGGAGLSEEPFGAGSGFMSEGRRFVCPLISNNCKKRVFEQCLIKTDLLPVNYGQNIGKG